ncbi:MAG: stage V sporulation protein AD [Ruminococcaceae bacterium]|nr:stage V sporulation protein AD [Oscillospiraceae bacterium]
MILRFPHAPRILSHASAVGKKESEGFLKGRFDLSDETDLFGQKTFEQAESEMLRLSFNAAAAKGGIKESEVECMLAGDLINQCTSTSYGLLDYNSPHFGLYGACSTCAEGLILAAVLTDGGYCRLVSASTSSHYCSAERQFRYPLEYGGQRTPTAQWTVTGAATFLVGREGDGPRITEAMPGISVEKGIKDASNMGAAMAPAAIETLTRYFEESGTSPSDFDLIATGDLGYEGHAIVHAYMKQYHLFNYTDCGLLIYDREQQDMHAGGSGCGCSAVVLSAYLLDEMKKGRLNDILFIGTGALMSPQSVQQGLPIAGIAHLVRLQNG